MADLNDRILTFLETYGQPQGLGAIKQRNEELGGKDDDDVQSALDEMVEGKLIRRVKAGVHANGEPTLEYAPLAYKG